METAALKRTPLYALHRERGGKMVPFAGYEMPVQYDGMGVLKEHLHTRAEAGLFDVSHMGQALLTGADPAAALEKIVPGDIRGLAPGQIRYTVLLNDKGGIIDDLMVTRWDAHTLFLVVNASRKDVDYACIRAALGAAALLHPLEDRGLLALQGPKSEQVMGLFYPDALSMGFMTAAKTPYKGQDIFISRSGYTGEDGFEISVPAALSETFAREMLEEEEVRLIGLGARDSLRLEAGLCLYGHDIDENASPVDAGLNWVIAKRRRSEADFAGATYIMKQIEGGTFIRRVGLRPAGRAPLREGTELFTTDGKKAGVITSGGFGPSVGGPVAMGYVDTVHAVVGTVLQAHLRGAEQPVMVAALPFVPHKYKKA